MLKKLGIKVVDKDYNEVAKAYEEFIAKKNKDEEQVRE